MKFKVYKLTPNTNSTSGDRIASSSNYTLLETVTISNANLQAGIIIDVNQQYTQSGTGVQSEVNGNYSNQKCFEAHLNKSLGAYTDGYCYHSNIVTTSSGGTAFHAYFKDNGTLKFRIYQNGKGYYRNGW